MGKTESKANWDTAHEGNRVPYNDDAPDASSAYYGLFDIGDAWKDGNINKAVKATAALNGISTTDCNGKCTIPLLSTKLKKEMLYGKKGTSKGSTPIDTLSFRGYPTPHVTVKMYSRGKSYVQFNEDSSHNWTCMDLQMEAFSTYKMPFPVQVVVHIQKLARNGNYLVTNGDYKKVKITIPTGGTSNVSPPDTFGVGKFDSGQVGTVMSFDAVGYVSILDGSSWLTSETCPMYFHGSVLAQDITGGYVKASLTSGTNDSAYTAPPQIDGKVLGTIYSYFTQDVTTKKWSETSNVGMAAGVRLFGYGDLDDLTWREGESLPPYNGVVYQFISGGMPTYSVMNIKNGKMTRVDFREYYQPPKYVYPSCDNNTYEVDAIQQLVQQPNNAALWSSYGC